MSNKPIQRRDFLKLLAGSAGAALVFQVISKVQSVGARATSSSGGEGSRSWAMVIDQEKCNGCGYCVNACRASNDVPPTMSWNKLYKVEEIDGKEIFLSVPCQHCEHAPCVSVCPVGASSYRPDGIVVMDYDLCIG